MPTSFGDFQAIGNKSPHFNMKTATLLLVSLSGLLLAGCQSRSYDVNGSQPVRYAREVQIVMLNPSARPVSPTIQIFENATEVKRAFTKIALLHRSGHREDEGLIVNAMAWRARQIGADTIIILPAGRGWPDYQFHAQAIVFNP
jgi:hypothetical protein